MARFSSRHPPTSTRTIQWRRASAWRTCSAPRARRNCSADEPIPDPPLAPAAPHSGLAPPCAGDAPRPLAARVAPVRVPRGGHPAGSRRLARCLSDFGGRAREGCRAGTTARARRHHSLWPSRGQGRDRLGGVRRAGDRAAGRAGGETGCARPPRDGGCVPVRVHRPRSLRRRAGRRRRQRRVGISRSEEHTSELQSPCNLVCRLLLEKKKKKLKNHKNLKQKKKKQKKT